MKQEESSYSWPGRGYEYYTNFMVDYRITITVFLFFCELILILFSIAGKEALVIFRASFSKKH